MRKAEGVTIQGDSARAEASRSRSTHMSFQFAGKVRPSEYFPCLGILF
jgi:hypothetical protein